MLKPVCVKCQSSMRCSENGIKGLLMAGDRPYQLWSGDAYKCPECGLEVIASWGKSAIACDFEFDLEKLAKEYEESGDRVIRF